jgi:hypothetical protein
MTEREQDLVERTSKVLGKETQYMYLVDIIEELLEVIENGIPNA